MNTTISDFMNTNKFTIYDSERIDNLVVNAQIANSILYLEDKKLMEISFLDKVKGKKDSFIQFYIPMKKLSNSQISTLLSYKKKENEKGKRTQRSKKNYDKLSQRPPRNS
jgi:hypothetical protein